MRSDTGRVRTRVRDCPAASSDHIRFVSHGSNTIRIPDSTVLPGVSQLGRVIHVINPG